MATTSCWNRLEMVAAIGVSSPKSAILRSTILLKEPSSHFLGKPLTGFYLQQNLKRRDVVSLVVTSASTTRNTEGGGGGRGADRFYFNVTGFPFPLGPFLNRRTIRTEVRLCYLHLTVYVHVTSNLWESHSRKQIHVNVD